MAKSKDRKIVFLFSGQGSQYYHMGKELFNHNSVFREWLIKLDTIAYPLVGESILHHLFHSSGKKDVFDRLLYSHPAIFMVEYALAQTLIADHIKPDYVLGTSLGEFTAATVAGVLQYPNALELVIRNAQAVESQCSPGWMVAILNEVSLYHNNPILKNNSELAAINYHSNFVISGYGEKLSSIESFLKERAIIYNILPVNYPFHSSFIKPAQSVFKKSLKDHKFNSPTIPCISCVGGAHLSQIPEYYLWDVAEKPILFQEAIQKLENHHSCIYVDLGPSGTLANFARYNYAKDSESINLSILTPFGQDLKNLEKAKKILTEKNIVTAPIKKHSPMKTYIFPGQGSQKKGMGGNLFDEFPELTTKADQILGYSIKKLCLEDPNQQLTQTQYTQPALYVVNALSYLKMVREQGKPDFVAGHSLGEYDALFAAGTFDFETGLRLVQKRGELMAQATGGGMAAVVGLPEEKIREILKANNLSSIDIANLNTPSQIVIAGPHNDILGAQPVFERAGVTAYIPLRVSGAFHSRYMHASAKVFENFLNPFQFTDAVLPVISNVHARPYKPGEIKTNLIAQITSPVRWNETIRYLMGKGDMIFEEIGPGNVLAGLVKKIRQEATPLVADEVHESKPMMVVKKPEVIKTPTSENVNTTTPATRSLYSSPEQSGNKTAVSLAYETATPYNSREMANSYASANNFSITPESLGCDEFKKDYNIKYAYVTGAMYRGVASAELVIRMANAGLMGYFGAGGLSLETVEEAIRKIQRSIRPGEAYGVNLLHQPMDPEMEEKTVDLFLKLGVRNAEAASFMSISPAVVKFRLKGLRRNGDGTIAIQNKIMAKVSRPEVAEQFLSPAPERIVKKLHAENKITPEEAELAISIPLADDICVEADSGGHTDQGVAQVLVPAMIRLREEMQDKFGYSKKIRIGAAGGIGTPEAAAAAFIMGVDFILTGSINQCTIEARTSDAVKEMLAKMHVQDTTYAPAGDLFEMGSKVQVLKKGVFFPARANKLYELYSHYNSLDEIDPNIQKQLQEKYFRRSFDEIYEDVKTYFSKQGPAELEKADKNPKHKMALIFRWYFGYTTRLAMEGIEDRKVDFQVHTGPALGACNQWLKGTTLENWRARHVDGIAEKLMRETATVLSKRLNIIMSKNNLAEKKQVGTETVFASELGAAS